MSKKGKTAGKLPDTGVKKYEYTAEEFVPFVKQLVEESKQSMRQVSLGAGLDHSALYRYLNQGQRPNQDACIALAHHLQVHPNEMLQTPGYPHHARVGGPITEYVIKHSRGVFPKPQWVDRSQRN